MKLAIIGAGNVGKGLAAAAVKAGHHVSVSSRNPEHYTEAAKATGARPVAIHDALGDADAVVLAIPASAVEDLAGEIEPAVRGKIVVDPTNRVNPGDPGAVLDGSSVAERIQARLPDAKVVKALNTLFAGVYANPKASGQALDGYVAGDDDAARASVLELVDSLGFRPIDAGPLAMGRVLEGMALLNITLQIRNGWPWQSGFKLVGPTGQG